MGGRGKESEPIEWTGWASLGKYELQENPEFSCMTRGTSLRKQAEVTGPYAVKKSLSPDRLSARTANRHW